MKHHVLSFPGRLVAVAGLAAAAVAPSVAQSSGVSLRSTPFPESSFLIARFAGFDAVEKIGRQTPILRWLDDTLRELRDSGLPDIRAEIARELANDMRYDLDPTLAGHLREGLQVPIAVGIGRSTLSAGIPLPSFAVALDLQNAEAGLGGRIQKAVLDAVGREMPVMARTAERGVQVYQLDAGRLTARLCVAECQGWLVFSNSPGFVEDCLQKHGTGAATEALQSARAQLGHPVIADLFVNVEPFVGAVAPVLPYELDELCAAIGIQRFDGVYAAIGLNADGTCQEMIQLGVPGADSGIVRALFGLPLSHGAAKFCPADTALYASLRFDVRAVLSRVREVVRRVSVHAGNELDAVLDHLAADIGNKFELDGSRVESLVSKVGSEITFAVPMIGGASGLLPQALACIDLKTDEESLQLVGHVQRMVDRMPGSGQMRSQEYRGVKIGYMALPEVPGVTLSIAVAHDQLLIASNVLLLKRTLARIADGKPSLADQEDFQKMQQHPAAHVVYSRLGRFAEPLWNTVQPFLASMIEDETDGEVDPLLLPESDQIAEMLRDSLLRIGGSESGLFIDQRSTVGLGLIVAIVSTLFDDALVLHAARAEQNGR